MAEQTPDSIITTQRNGQTIVAELFFNHSSTETFRDKLLNLPIVKYLRADWKDFMPEDTEAGQIQGFLEHYTGSMVCSKQLFKEALGHTYDEPKRWQLHNINEIMNTVVTGWKPFSNPRMFAGYGRQKGWERDVSGNELPGNEDGFVELSEEECRQLELPKEWIA